MKLPDKPSELLTLALKELRRVEKNKKYKIEMGSWHQPILKGDDWDNITECEVCLAGALMTQRLKLNEDFRWTYKYNKEEIAKFDAIDYLRCGKIRVALLELGIKTTKLPNSINITNYHDNKKQFYTDMRGLVKLLEGVGL